MNEISYNIAPDYRFKKIGTVVHNAVLTRFAPNNR